ncbi:MAG TPA: glycosyltransferase [Patescibacteria group bacterium]|nr:glycosyltransferase [Patescibacteria group bacterium]
MKIPKLSKKPLVSIVIPAYIVSARFSEDLRKFDLLTYPNYEILVICDKKIQLPKVKNIRLIVTKAGHTTGPAEKRDIALRHAKGEICAYIDDDAYPDPTWLTQAIELFRTYPVIVALGGPGVTPPEDPYLAQISGIVYESDLTSGKLKFRFTNAHQKRQYMTDWPAYNLFIKTNVLKSVGGWESTFYGGEDTFVCLKLLKYGKMLYDPDVVVYHHRRPLFSQYLRQISNVGVHRGYFFKRYPETSRSLFYCLPLLLTIGFWLLVMMSIISLPARLIFGLVFLIFYSMAYGSVSGKTNVFGSLLASLGVILTHMAYGWGFLNGLLTDHMVR